MHDPPSPLWDELVDEFRALGGSMDNVRLGHGPLGRGLFVVDPARPFLVRAPENLLVSVSDIVFENGTLKVAAGANVGVRERKFYEDYYAFISWGDGGREEIERIFEQAAQLPPELRHKLFTDYICGEWFDEPSLGLIQKQFIDSREISFRGRIAMMPIIELANHGAVCSYDETDGLSLRGTAQDEITVQYASTDTSIMFISWGFVAECDSAYSIALRTAVGTTPLHVYRRTVNTTIGVKPVPPTLTTIDGGALQLNFLMLGNRRMPRLCRGNFRSVLRAAGHTDVDETFDKIRMVNQGHYLALLGDLETLDGPMVRQLRRMARLQLLALTYCFGVREL